VERTRQPGQAFDGPRPRVLAGDCPGRRTHKAGQPGCSVLLREREDGPWMLIGAALVTETAVVWDGGVSGVRYGTDSPTAMWMTPRDEVCAPNPQSRDHCV
jgi:hypothetical protein